MSSHVCVLLVPGAWHGPWAWDEVSHRLADRGFNVSVVEPASTGAEPATFGGGLYDDAARFREAAARLPGTVLAVGHTVGGQTEPLRQWCVRWFGPIRSVGIRRG